MLVLKTMKLDMESKEIKEMDLSKKSDSQHKDDSVVNTSIASTSGSIKDYNDSKEIRAEDIASTSKEEVVVKLEDSEVFETDALAVQNADSKSEDCMVTSTCELSELDSSFIFASAKLENASKAEESDVCMADKQNADNAAVLTSNLNSDESCPIKMPSKENLSTAKESKSTFKIEDDKSHRENIHYSSESSEDETDESSDSSDDDKFFNDLHKSASTKLPVLTTKGEILPEDLPPVADLHITVNSTELLKIGNILHNLISEARNEYFVIVESDGNSNPLDDDSILFLAADKPLGRIHDVFGNVSRPNYVVRFNKADDIFNKGVTPGQTVYYSPANGDLTRYVLVDVLKKQKGSDASWKDNNEPPDDEIDYSDDEQEKLAKQKRRAKSRGKERNWNDREVEDVTPNKMERRDVAYSQKRAFKRPSRNMFPSPTPGPSRPSSRSQNFGSPPSPSDNFGSGLLRNAVSPRPFGPRDLFLLSDRSSLQPFRPFSQNNAPSPQHFETSMSSYQPFSVPPTYDLASSNIPSSHAACAPELTRPAFMAAPQNNVPLQQQLLLQPQQSFATLLSRPPPNYNPHQNSAPHRQQSFTPPVFGALPSARPAPQNFTNKLFGNPMHFSSGTNAPHIGLSGNLNISQFTNIVPINSVGHQGQSSSMMPSNTANSYIFAQFPPRHTQHNINPPIPELLVSVHSSSSSPLTPPPRPNPPFVPCQTPPNFLNPQSLSVTSSSHPPILPSQTPPPLPNQNLSFFSSVHPPLLPSQTPPPLPNQNVAIFSSVHPPILPSQTPPSSVHFCSVPIPGNLFSAQNHRPY